MKRLLFIDTCAPSEYSDITLKNKPLGGTEGTCIRVAEGLAKTGEYRVYVAQEKRKGVYDSAAGVTYLPIDCLREFVRRPEFIVCLRDPGALKLARQVSKDARVYLWLHDFNQNEVARSVQDLYKVTVICVSDYHKTQVVEAFRRNPDASYSAQVVVKRIYNPVADELQPDSTPVDRNKLVWLSSPHKGLDYAISLFRDVSRVSGCLRLFVGNPGYLPDSELSSGTTDNLVFLGSLPHSDIIYHVRNSLAVFYPNCVFPETFGLVLAEANAVGTPVLTSHLGAAPEVLSPAYSQCLDVKNKQAVISRILAWQKDRPAVSCKPAFRLTAVIEAWKEVLR